MIDFISPFDPCPPNAEWRQIPIAPDYDISEYGHIRRRTTSRSFKAGRILRAHLDTSGYPIYGLRINNKQRTLPVHKLVITVFVGPPPADKLQAAHGDGKPTNCHYTNLRWATAQENQADKRRHGTMRCGPEWGERMKRAPLPRGEKHHSAKLTADDVREIRRSPLSTVRLAAQYGVTNALIGRIKRGLIWRAVA